jgi:hypothetical protein
MASAVDDTDEGVEVTVDAGAGSSAGWPVAGGEPAQRTVAGRMNRVTIRKVIGIPVECLIL